jgi:hypothetical protein
MIEYAIVLKSLGDAITLARAVGEAKTAWETADLKYKMAEVTSALADAKNALTDAQVELRDKDSEIERLTEAFKRIDKTVEFDGKYYRKGPDGKPRGRAFCPVCWDQARPFLLDQNRKAPRGAMKCARCKTEYDLVPQFSDDGHSI